MTDKKDLLIEIGTEEMPPASLKMLAVALHDSFCESLQNGQLNFTESKWYATPRRFALLISQLDTAQQDTEQQRKGPSLKAALNADGNPTKATEGFARSCGVTVDELERLETEKGSWLACTQKVKGKQTIDLIPEWLEQALKKLPIARRMRWGDRDIEFVRPIQWFLLQFGSDNADCNILGMDSINHSFGHRFHHPSKITITEASEYATTLREEAYVVADYAERQATIRQQVNRLTGEINGTAIIDDGLVEEVTSLVEWPAAFVGRFDPGFLALPEEVLIVNMQDHQKYFPVRDQDGKLMPNFIGVANIESRASERLIAGNERVIRPRLADAVFFWERDIKHGLANHIDGLSDVVYQKQLGSLHQRMQRISSTVSYLADIMGADADKLRRAAELCFCDLLTEMVYEFPELQGTMGKYYAEAAGEESEVALALEAFYQPRFSGDTLPDSIIGLCLSLSGKLESLIGIFAIGQAPTGDKDPYNLRRAAIGAIRILFECRFDIDLHALLQHIASQFDAAIQASSVVDTVFEFVMERLRRYYLEQGISPDSFNAVFSESPSSLPDFEERLQAVTNFRKLPEAESLAVTNKRISNLLNKSSQNVSDEINTALLTEKAEKTLANTVGEYRSKLAPMLDKGEYQQALATLAEVKSIVDDFFDHVMVMCEDEATRNNRLGLLTNLQKLFLQIADISQLHGS